MSQRYEEEILEVCPDCGGEVKYYHGSGITRVVCKNHCKGWKVIREIDILEEHRKFALRRIKEGGEKG